MGLEQQITTALYSPHLLDLDAACVSGSGEHPFVLSLLDRCLDKALTEGNAAFV